MLLEILSTEVMKGQIMALDELVVSLRGQLNDAHETILSLEGVRLREIGEREERINIDIDVSNKRLALLQKLFDECKLELTRAKNEIVSWEKLFIDKEITDFENFGTRSPNQRSEAIGSGLLNKSIQITSSDVDQDTTELEYTKSLLRERNVQLKIVVDTIDALQVSGIAQFKSYSEKDTDRNSLALSSSARHIDSPWIMQSLIKRIVELTTDLSSQSATTLIYERRMLQLEASCQRKSRELGSLRSLLQNHEEMNSQMKLNIHALSIQLRNSEHHRIEIASSLRNDIEILKTCLRNAESQLRSQDVTIDSLTRQINFNERFDCKHWLENIILKDTEICVNHLKSRSVVKKSRNLDDGSQDMYEHTRTPSSIRFTPNNRGKGPEDLQVLVLDLLGKLKQSVGIESSKLSNRSNLNSSQNVTEVEAEQLFFKKISDFVSTANHKCYIALQDSWRADSQRMKAELALKVGQDRLRMAGIG